MLMKDLRDRLVAARTAIEEKKDGTPKVGAG
jgi:hypothetical protein